MAYSMPFRPRIDPKTGRPFNAAMMEDKLLNVGNVFPSPPNPDVIRQVVEDAARYRDMFQNAKRRRPPPPPAASSSSQADINPDLAGLSMPHQEIYGTFDEHFGKSEEAAAGSFDMFGAYTGPPKADKRETATTSQMKQPQPIPEHIRQHYLQMYGMDLGISFANQSAAAEQKYTEMIEFRIITLPQLIIDQMQ